MINKKSIGFQVKTLEMLFERKAIKLAKEKGVPLITPIQNGICLFLYKNKDDEVYQRDIEKEFKLRRSTSSGILKTLEKNKLIISGSSKKDARLKRIQITEKGIENLAKTKSFFDEIENMMIENINLQDLDIFYKVIDQVKNNICSEGNDSDDKDV